MAAETHVLPIPQGWGWRDLRGCGFSVDGAQLVNISFKFKLFVTYVKDLCKSDSFTEILPLCLLLEFL